MPGAHDALAFYEAVADEAAVVRALVVDHHERAAREPRDRDRAGPVAGGDQPADRDVDVVDLWPPVVRVVAKLVE